MNTTMRYFFVCACFLVTACGVPDDFPTIDRTVSTQAQAAGWPDLLTVEQLQTLLPDTEVELTNPGATLIYRMDRLKKRADEIRNN